MNYKKVLALVLAFVLTIVVTIGATVAWLTADGGEKNNVFTVGEIKIELDEEVGVEGEGAIVTKTDEGAQYSGAMPGDKLIKKPTVTNTGNKAAYVAITVTVNNAYKINEAIDEYYESNGATDEEIQAVYDEVFTGWGLNYKKVDANGNALGMRLTITGEDMPENVLHVDSVKTIDEYWLQYSGNWFLDLDTIIPFDGYYTTGMNEYELKYTYYAYLEPGESVTVFEGLNVPDEFVAEQLAMFEGLNINVKASAIQADNFEVPQEAFAELAGFDWEANTIEADDSWYNDTDKAFSLNTPEQLAGLAELVNGGNNFFGKTITLTSDVDLGNAEWTPIGNSSNKFSGTFDGADHTISNLYVSGDNSYVGLFGFTTNGEIKNLTVENASVSGYLGVGVVAGSPYTSDYTNITVTGHVEVNGMSYVGTVGGRNAYADWTDITVDVDADSYVKANSVEGDIAYRTYVGGVVGFMGEGGQTMKNVTSNINVIGSTCDVGGIIGIAHYGNTFIDCHSTGNVTITNGDATEEEIGGIAGVWHNGGSPVTFEGCSFEGLLYVVGGTADLTNNTITGAAYSATGNGELVIK